jgi:hypothetical protein
MGGSVINVCSSTFSLLVVVKVAILTRRTRSMQGNYVWHRSQRQLLASYARTVIQS